MANYRSAKKHMKSLLDTSKYNTKLLFNSKSDGYANVSLHSNNNRMHLMSKVFDEYKLVKDLNASGPLPNMNSDKKNKLHKKKKNSEMMSRNCTVPSIGKKFQNTLSQRVFEINLREKMR